MPRTVLIVSSNHGLTGVAFRVLGRSRQPAWVFTPDAATRPARSRWRAGVVGPIAEDLGPAIVEAARTVGATHVLPDDVAMFAAVAGVAADLAPAKPFPSLSPSEILRFDNKETFADLATALGLPVVPTHRAESAAAAGQNPFDYPILIKPVHGAAGSGQRRCDSRSDLAALLPTWPEERLVIQPFTPGSDVHVSFIADRGELISWEVHKPVPSVAPTPGMFRIINDEPALDIASRLARRTSYHGIANLDFRRDAVTGELALLECNPRLYFTMDVAARAGADLLTLGLDLADGHRPEQPVIARRGVLHTGRGLRTTVMSRPRVRHYPRVARAVIAGLADIPLTFDMSSLAGHN